MDGLIKNDFLPGSIEGLMGLLEKLLVSPSFKGLDVMNESPLPFY